MNRAPIGLRGAYDRPAAAQYLSISERTLDDLIRLGHITTYTPLGMKVAVMIRREVLDAYIEASESGVPHLQAVGE